MCSLWCTLIIFVADRYSSARGRFGIASRAAVVVSCVFRFINGNTQWCSYIYAKRHVSFWHGPFHVNSIYRHGAASVWLLLRNISRRPATDQSLHASHSKQVGQVRRKYPTVTRAGQVDGTGRNINIANDDKRCDSNAARTSRDQK